MPTGYEYVQSPNESQRRPSPQVVRLLQLAVCKLLEPLVGGSLLAFFHLFSFPPSSSCAVIPRAQRTEVAPFACAGLALRYSALVARNRRKLTTSSVGTPQPPRDRIGFRGIGMGDAPIPSPFSARQNGAHGGPASRQYSQFSFSGTKQHQHQLVLGSICHLPT